MSSSSHRYAESPIFDYNTSGNQRIHIPIHRLSNASNYEFNNQSPLKDTTLQWVNDPINGNEKFQIKINIQGFNQNEVNVRVDGNKLFIYGERIENKSQGTSKKIIEKFYDLPPDIDTFRPHVTFPSSIIMQIDFPSKHVSAQSHQYALPQKSNFKDKNRKIPIQRISIDSSANLPIDYSLRNKNNTYNEQTTIETRRRRSSPATGLQSAYEFEQHRSNSPTLSNIIEEDSDHSIISITDSTTESSIFPQDFDSEAFYRSIFQPEIFTDGSNQRYIEMKLDVKDYNPDDIKVSINDNDLLVQIKNTNFSKQITLPANIDLASLSLHHHYDKKLYITIQLLDEYSSFKYI